MQNPYEIDYGIENNKQKRKLDLNLCVLFEQNFIIYKKYKKTNTPPNKTTNTHNKRKFAKL